MSSIATFFRTLPDTLQQPVALAMLGSLGAHLLVFATLPAFTSPNEPRPEAEVRRVRLVEPPQGSPGSQIARSQAGLPPVPNTPNSRIQLPASGNSPVPNPLYTLPGLDSNSTFVPVPVPPPISFQDRLAARQRAREQIREYERRVAEGQRRLEQQQRQAEKPPTPPPAPQPTIAPNTTLTPFDPSILAKQPGTEQPSENSQPTPAPTTAPTTAPTAPNVQPGVEQNNQRLALNRYSSEGTTPQEGLQAQANLTEQLNQKFPDAWEYIRLKPREEPIRELEYPLNFALQNYQQHPAVIAVLVGKDGKPLADQKPVILNSTGYPILNDKAIEIVQRDAAQPNRFPAIEEDRVRAFVYEFKFKAPNTGAAPS